VILAALGLTAAVVLVVIAGGGDGSGDARDRAGNASAGGTSSTSAEAIPTTGTGPGTATSADGAGPPTGTGSGVAAAPTVGPLCDLLPAGDAPGGPGDLTDQRADVAIEAIPVLTVFAAGIRATGLDFLLAGADPITIVAPTDEAFQSAFSVDLIDELIIDRQDELRALLETHLVGGSHPLAALVDAGEATTVGGQTVVVARSGTDGARFDDRATSVCADYAVANGRIHIVDDVLGAWPPEPATTLPHAG
jgi:uncharacterized surface protein with fasciclin (FAS1) repeats